MLENHKLLKNLFLVVVATIGLSGCSSDSNPNNDNGSAKSTAGVVIPSTIKATALPNTGTLTAKIFVDGSTNAASSKTVDLSAMEVTFTLTVATGDHNFTVVFYFDDLVYNSQTWELARATTSSPVSVGKGSTTKVTSFNPYSYQDFDGDGVSNLLELGAGTDPGLGACVLDSANIPCQLG